MTDATLPAAAIDPAAAARRRRVTNILVHVALIAASIVMLYPLLWMLSASVRPEEEIFTSGSIWPSEISFDAYRHGWNALQVSFGTFYWNSFVIAVLSVIGNVLACSLAAFAFARLNFRGRNFWFALMLGTLMIPYHVTLIRSTCCS